MESRRRWRETAISIVLAAVLIAAVLGLVYGRGAIAAPAAAPTPVIQAAADFPRTNVTLLGETVIETTTAQAGTAYGLAKYDAMDVQTTIDISDTQTVTVKLQYTNYPALINWVDGLNVAASITADSNTMNQYHNFGRYTRIVATASTTAPVTVTVRAVGK